MMSGKGNKRYSRNSQKKDNKIRQRVKMEGERERMRRASKKGGLMRERATKKIQRKSEER